MNPLIRFLMFINSLILALISVLLLYAVIDDGIFADLLSPLSTIVTNKTTKYVYFIILILIICSCTYLIVKALLSNRLGNTRIRRTEIGAVDIDGAAIESIALNSAKTAQVGIKSAKVHVSSGKNNAIKVLINSVLYSNVEIPASMAKVQEKVKKDIERYTGISVEAVTVKVSKVEPVVAKVDK